jgi:hypothetical protein
MSNLEEHLQYLLCKSIKKKHKNRHTQLSLELTFSLSLPTSGLPPLMAIEMATYLNHVDVSPID